MSHPDDVDFDPSSPEARRTAELARQLVTARLSGGAELAGTTMREVAEEVAGDPVAVGYLLAATTFLTTAVLAGWQQHAGVDAGDAFRAIALALEESGQTI